MFLGRILGLGHSILQKKTFDLWPLSFLVENTTSKKNGRLSTTFFLVYIGTEIALSC